MNLKPFAAAGAIASVFAAGAAAHLASASYHFSNFKGRPPIHIDGSATKVPTGLSPAQVKAAYHLPSSGGHGTIAIIGAYDDATIETDLNFFSKTFGLPSCTTSNDCFEKHQLASGIKGNSGWSMETRLDIEWAHAIAPQAKILLVQAPTPSGSNLLKAIDYAASRSDVVAISMSWGGAEFPEELSLENHFLSKSGAMFFASSGDNGAGASWPAASPHVVSVGGTYLNLDARGGFVSETAWTGSGGGVSAYEKQPSFQASYSIPKANGMRAIPDVSYNADPSSGFSIYRSTSKSKAGLWYKVGGTSAGAPQWAAIQSLGLSVSPQKIYEDKSSSGSAGYFRDITSGYNGDCTYYCTARTHYDYVTGLGSPLTDNF